MPLYGVLGLEPREKLKAEVKAVFGWLSSYLASLMCQLLLVMKRGGGRDRERVHTRASEHVVTAHQKRQDI